MTNPSLRLQWAAPKATKTTSLSTSLPAGRRILLATVCAATVAVAGCSTTPPPRTAYDGPDRVTTVQPAMLIGSWDVRILNPIPGEKNQQVTAKYNADGSVVVNSVSTEVGMQMSFRMIGRWSVNGDQITQTLESMEETSGKPINALIRPFVGSMKSRASGTANVYEASSDRVVLVSEHGQAQELTRLP